LETLFPSLGPLFSFLETLFPVLGTAAFFHYSRIQGERWRITPAVLGSLAIGRVARAALAPTGGTAQNVDDDRGNPWVT
jgi:hypothetical protein